MSRQAHPVQFSGSPSAGGGERHRMHSRSGRAVRLPIGRPPIAQCKSPSRASWNPSSATCPYPRPAGRRRTWRPGFDHRHTLRDRKGAEFQCAGGRKAENRDHAPGARQRGVSENEIRQGQVPHGAGHGAPERVDRVACFTRRWIEMADRIAVAPSPGRHHDRRPGNRHLPLSLYAVYTSRHEKTTPISRRAP